MNSKEAVVDIMNQTSSYASLEEVLYSIYVREQIEAGLKDVENGNVISSDEAETRLSIWDIDQL